MIEGVTHAHFESTFKRHPFANQCQILNICFDLFHCACLQKTATNIRHSKFDTSKSMSCREHKVRTCATHVWPFSCTVLCDNQNLTILLQKKCNDFFSKKCECVCGCKNFIKKITLLHTLKLTLYGKLRR